MSIMVFDIETVPDVNAGRRLYDMDDVDDADVAKAMFAKRQQQTGRDFLQHPLHQVVAISAVWQSASGVSVKTLGDESSSEAEIIQLFFNALDKLPTIVSWNGGGFDLPVLHYRALKLGVQAPRYWERGSNDQSFKWDNYLSRYHWRHLDLMDVLAGFQPRANAPLDMVATMLGFPGKMGMDGSKVWSAFLDGKLQDIRDYCEHDVLNTYLVYLRFELMRGEINQVEYNDRCTQLLDELLSSEKPHLSEFAELWAPDLDQHAQDASN